MRLSRKGWNNVLIFAVLGIIFIFNFAPKLTLSTKQQQRTVIDKQLTIVEIKTPDFKIKRVGRSWKSEPNLGLSEQQLAFIVHNWQNLSLPSHEAIENAMDPYIISIYTANRDQPIIIHLVQQDENYLLQRDATTVLFLSAQQLPLLLGR